MKRRIGIAIPLLILGMISGSLARAASSGTANVTLTASAQAMIQILDPTLVLSPTPTDYDVDFVEAAGASGLRVRVKTNSSTGMVLLVKCVDAAPGIALADLWVRTQSASPTGGATLSSYSPISALDQTLWTTGASQHPWFTVTTDVMVQNLINYDDSVTPGPTNYTNTLTYTVVAQ